MPQDFDMSEFDNAALDASAAQLDPVLGNIDTTGQHDPVPSQPSLE